MSHPTETDSLVSDPSTLSPNSHRTAWTALRAAIQSVRTEIGANPSGVIDINITDYGAVAGAELFDGVMTSGSGILTSATAAFTAADVGKSISVARATTSTRTLVATITVFTNSTTVTMSQAAAFTGTGRTLRIDGTMRVVTDAATTAGSTTLTSATATFTAADVGKVIFVSTADAVSLNTTIASRQSATQVTLTASATRSVTAQKVVYGTDNTTAIRNALIAASAATTNGLTSRVRVPSGLFLLALSSGGAGGTLLESNVHLVGNGWDSRLRNIGGGAASTSLVGINTGSLGTTSITGNDYNIVIEDLAFEGTCEMEGFLENQDLLSINSATNVTVRNCKFTGMRGDGIYLGSGTTAGIERHNKGIRIVNCVFDGLNWQNRQGISVIDCEDLIIFGCYFANVARPEDMPGAIDFEPNPANTWAILRDCRVDSCTFENIGGNQGTVVVWLWSSTYTYTRAINNIAIKNCTFKPSLGTTSPVVVRYEVTPSDSSDRVDIDIDGNTVVDGYYAFQVEGVRGVKIRNNIVRGTEFSGVILGYAYPARDVEITNNMWFQCTTQGTQVIEIVRCVRGEITGNYFSDCGDAAGGQGFVLRFTVGNGSTGSSDNIRFKRNHVNKGTRFTALMGSVVSGHTITATGNIWSGNFHPSLASLQTAAFPSGVNTVVYTVSAASLTVDPSLVDDYGRIVINTSATANTTLTVGNALLGATRTFEWVITGASQAYVHASNMKFAAATAPTKSTTAGRRDIVTFVYDGTSWNEVSRSINVG